MDRGRLLSALVGLADMAGTAIMPFYRTGAEVRRKEDSSPVTEADEAAEALILKGLAELTPEVPVVAEEAAAAGRVPDVAGGRFWLVDPLDGTREFIGGRGEFTVNIGLIEDGRPVLGVVTAPAMGEAWWGAAGLGAWHRDALGEEMIAVRPRPATGVIAVASKSHSNPETEAFLDAEGVCERIAAGSSLKFCRVAEGKADVYPRLGRTMEWDTAAAHAVLAAAGGSVSRLEDRTPLLYGKPGFENPHFIARGG
ncbi:3'(2'),5'-bisphosphate nucleotidase CysQ [Marinivivus vitaminiproducens]|uniref:3'(2'),5'-bisphosphate nucleotidase CysQ n=1 Tax=Marinivivus vitaminiproducens TaxID=3035935 RepID=UPI0027A92FB3|nr:3'(2'),5'-bisphosphate nucleotidase CysQ [Geminicoccaceae bacterium SCSIO 64248]